MTSFARDGLVFDVLDVGPRDGDVVVLLHGFPQRASCWAAVTPLLTSRGLRVIAPDQRGYSRGARPRGRSAYAMGELVADLIALSREIGAGPVHLVGHDWGAAVGWATVALHPELVVSFTAVSVPHPQAMVRSLWRSKQGLKSWYVASLQVPLVPEFVARRWPSWVEGLLRRSGMEEPVIRRFRAEIIDDGAFATAINWYRAIALGGPSGARKIGVPTTMVWSDGDVAITRSAVDLCAEFMDADYRLEVLSGIDHWIPEHAPQALAALILDRVAGTSPA